MYISSIEKLIEIIDLGLKLREIDTKKELGVYLYNLILSNSFPSNVDVLLRYNKRYYIINWNLPNSNNNILILLRNKFISKIFKKERVYYIIEEEIKGD